MAPLSGPDEQIVGSDSPNSIPFLCQFGRLRYRSPVLPMPPGRNSNAPLHSGKSGQDSPNSFCYRASVCFLCPQPASLASRVCCSFTTRVTHQFLTGLPDAVFFLPSTQTQPWVSFCIGPKVRSSKLSIIPFIISSGAKLKLRLSRPQSLTSLGLQQSPAGARARNRWIIHIPASRTTI